MSLTAAEQDENIRSIIEMARAPMKAHLDVRVAKGDVEGGILAANRFEEAAIQLTNMRRDMPEVGEGEG